MTTIPLQQIPQLNREISLFWLLNTLGSMGERWTFDKLSNVVFYNDSDATMYLLRWA